MNGVSHSLKSVREGAVASFAQKLKFIERSQRTKRYHSEPTLHIQSVGEHTHGVALLVHLMTEGRASAALLTAVLFHDVPECATGDVPSPVKRAADISEAMNALEDRVMAYYGISWPTLTQEEQLILKLADLLEGLNYCAFELRMGNREIQDCFQNYLEYTARLLERERLAPQIANGPLGSHLVVANVIFELRIKEYNDVFGK